MIVNQLKKPPTVDKLTNQLKQRGQMYSYQQLDVRTYLNTVAAPLETVMKAKKGKQHFEGGLDPCTYDKRPNTLLTEKRTA